MIVGHYTRDDRPMISLTLRNDDGEEIEIEAAIDTGFVGALFLPNQIVRRLNLPETDRETVMLADGSLSRLPLYAVTVVWEEEERLVSAFGANGIALVGNELLGGSVGYDGQDVNL